jgi:multiple sugar transport system permease protein
VSISSESSPRSGTGPRGAPPRRPAGTDRATAPARAAAPAARRRRTARRRRDGLVPYLFVLPAILYLGALLAYPVVINVVTSFQHLTAINLLRGDAPWVGLRNYRTALHDPLAGSAALHSVEYTAVAVTVQMGLALCLALLYSQAFPGARSLRSLYLVGYAIPVVVSAEVFRWMLDGRTGFVNWLLQAVHLQDPDNPVYWLADTYTALPALMGVQVWLGVPFTMIALTAGLTVIPAELYEAARMDGAGAWARFRYVTWPHLRPTFFTVAVLTVIFCFKSFDLVWIATQGGPAGASEVLPTLAYRLVFQQFQFGEGAAVLNAVFLVLLILSGVYLYALHREEKSA